MTTDGKDKSTTCPAESSGDIIRWTPNTMVKASCLMAALSIPLYCIGACMRERHHHFDEWFASAAKSTSLDPGLGVALSVWWVFVGFVMASAVAAFIALLMVCIHLATRDSKTKHVLAMALYAAIAIPSALMVSISLIENLSWHFTVLATADLAVLLAIVTGAIAVARSTYNAHHRTGRQAYA